VRAGFERDVHRRSADVAAALAGVGERDDLGVGPTADAVPALTERAAVSLDDRSDDGIRRNAAPTACRELVCSCEINPIARIERYGVTSTPFQNAT